MWILLLFLCLALPASAINVEIGLGDYLEEATISSTTDYRLINRTTGAVIGDFYALGEVKLQTNGSSIKLISGYEPIGAFKGPIEMVPLAPEGKKALVALNGKWYRGTLRIFPTMVKQGFFSRDDGFTVVNKVDMEDYLKGVVPSEMPSSWHYEALKVQAICARTYTLAKLNRRREYGYDLKNNTEDQVYLGYSNEKNSTNKAISETDKLVLVDGSNRIVEAYYTSSAGGYTDSIEDVWGLSPLNYIVPVKDFDEESPYYSWKKKFSQEELSTKLEDFNIGRVKGLKILSRTKALRVSQVFISGDKSNVLLKGEELRHKLGLPSTKFNYGLEGNEIAFAGRGFGHGLGMSQYGSKALAEQGLSYEKILAHYYPNTKLMTI